MSKGQSKKNSIKQTPKHEILQQKMEKILRKTSL